MIPGQHIAVVTQDIYQAYRGRHLGWELRDTIQVMLPGPTVLLVHLFRVPIEESTVAGQVLATGTGALWIDGSRVSGVWGSRPKYLLTSKGVPGVYGRSQQRLEGEVKNSNAKGRWPPNLLLVHHPECLNQGVARVRGSHVPGKLAPVEDYTNERQKVYGKYAYKAPKPVVDPDGFETVASWQCHPTCPVGILDRQSAERGMHSGGHATDRTPNAVYGANGFTWTAGSVSSRHGDTGGASRFYPGFTDLAECLQWVDRLINGPV